MNFTVENLEFYLLVLIRISSFVMVAPFFNYQTIPMKWKFVISMVLSIVVIQSIPAVSLEYTGIIGFSALVVKECAVGLVLFAGQLMDMEMGLSMANMFDPLTNIQVSVSGSMYTYLVMLVMMATNMHHYVIRAILETFQFFTVGQAVFNGDIVEMAIGFVANYFVVGFRIVLPVFACMLVINVVLGVLTRAAPQMNMFVVGMQVKVMVGILLLLIIVSTIPTVADFIFGKMKDVVVDVYRSFTP